MNHHHPRGNTSTVYIAYLSTVVSFPPPQSPPPCYPLTPVCRITSRPSPFPVSLLPRSVDTPGQWATEWGLSSIKDDLLRGRQRRVFVILGGWSMHTKLAPRWDDDDRMRIGG